MKGTNAATTVRLTRAAVQLALEPGKEGRARRACVRAWRALLRGLEPREDAARV